MVSSRPSSRVSSVTPSPTLSTPSARLSLDVVYALKRQGRKFSHVSPLHDPSLTFLFRYPLRFRWLNHLFFSFPGWFTVRRDVGVFSDLFYYNCHGSLGLLFITLDYHYCASIVCASELFCIIAASTLRLAPWTWWDQALKCDPIRIQTKLEIILDFLGLACSINRRINVSYLGLFVFLACIVELDALF